MKIESKLFYNINGNTYYVLFGKKGEKAFLCNINCNQYVICQLLEENSWLHGNYYCDFEEAYDDWKEMNKNGFCRN